MVSIKSEGHERKVVLGPIHPEEARKLAMDVASQSCISANSVAKGVPEFTKEAFFSFRAEHTLIEDNLVIHFFVPKHAELCIKGDNNPAERQWMDYWLKVFPVKLDVVARKYFDAEYPRLQAKYTPEMASWWFRAQNYGRLLSPTQFTHQFLEELNTSLQQHN